MHKREGAQEPRCARSEGRCGAVGFYVVVAATAGPRARRGGDPWTAPRPLEVCPRQYGRLDTGTSALEDAANDDIAHATDVLIVGKRVPVFLSVDLVVVSCLPYVNPSAPCRHALDLVMPEIVSSL